MKLVPFVLCAMGALMLCLAGCRKEEKKPEIPASSPASYVHDKAFMGALAAERVKHSDLMRARNAIADRMKDMIEAKKAEMKTSDLKKIKAELEKDPAWQTLYAECTNANARVERHQREVFGKVRERIAPARSGRDSASPLNKEISK